MRDLADQLWELMLDHHTLRANLLGLRDDGELQDHSEEADQDHLRRYQAIAEEAARRTAETEDDRITRDLVLHLTRAECDTIESRTIEFGVSCYLQDAVPELLYFLGHLKSHHAVPRFLTTVAERHRAGIRAGRTPVRHLVEQAIAFVDQYDDPAVRHYRDVLVNDVLPHGRDEEHGGLCWLPDGEALYRKVIRTHTTLDLDPHELNATGLRLIEDLKRGVRRTSAHRPEVHRRRGDDPGRREGHAQGRIHCPAMVPDGAARQVRDRPDRTVSARERAAALRPRRTRRQPARHVLRQRQGTAHPAPQHRGGDGVPRGGAGPPLRERETRTAGAPATAPPQGAGHGVQRGLGGLLGTPGRRDGPLPHRRGPPRHAHQGRHARGPARRRHRPARQGLESAAGHRLPAREHADAARTGRRRGRPLPGPTGPGARVHGGTAQVPGAARQSRAGARSGVRRP